MSAPLTSVLSVITVTSYRRKNLVAFYLFFNLYTCNLVEVHNHVFTTNRRNILTGII